MPFLIDYTNDPEGSKKRFEIAEKVVKTRAKCNGNCLTSKCWIASNGRDCAEIYQRAKDILEELPWKVEV